MFSSDSSFRRTRVAAHLSDAAPAEVDVVAVEGWLTYYDESEKSWKPLKGKLHVYIDGRHIGETESNSYGAFSLHFPAPSVGRHKIEVRFKGKFGYEPSSKSLEFQVIEPLEKERLGRLMRNAVLLIMLLIFVLLLSVFMAKLRPP